MHSLRAITFGFAFQVLIFYADEGGDIRNVEIDTPKGIETVEVKVNEGEVVRVDKKRKQLLVKTDRRTIRLPLGKTHVATTAKPNDFSTEAAVLRPGDTIEFGRNANYVFVWKVVQESKPNEWDKPLPIPTPEAVADVLILDSESKKNRFNLLTKVRQTDLLRVAGCIKDDRHHGRVIWRATFPHDSDLLDPKQLRLWLLKRADEFGVAELIEALEVPEKDQEQVKLAFASLQFVGHARQFKYVAKRIKDVGIENLTDFEKEFVRKNRTVFNIM